jgi:hypothetical protein
LLEENPLKHKKRQQLKPGQAAPVLSKEEQLMEEKFVTFDYTKPKKTTALGNTSFIDLGPIAREESPTKSPGSPTSPGSQPDVEKTAAPAEEPKTEPAAT